MHKPLSCRHRVIADDDIVLIRRPIADHPGVSRWALSRKLCEARDWVQAHGALRDRVRRGLMPKLHREGSSALPPARSIALDRSKRGPPPLAVDDTPVQMSLAELGPIELRQVRQIGPTATRHFSAIPSQASLFLTPPPHEYQNSLVQLRPVDGHDRNRTDSSVHLSLPRVSAAHWQRVWRASPVRSERSHDQRRFNQVRASR